MIVFSYSINTTDLNTLYYSFLGTAVQTGSFLLCYMDLIPQRQNSFAYGAIAQRLKSVILQVS